jgi:hypothetical protein
VSTDGPTPTAAPLTASQPRPVETLAANAIGAGSLGPRATLCAVDRILGAASALREIDSSPLISMYWDFWI